MVSRMIPLPGLQIYAWPWHLTFCIRVVVTQWEFTIMCLPGLAKICQIVLEISHLKGFVTYFDLFQPWPWLPDPEVDHFMPLSVDHLCQLTSKLIHSFSHYRVHKFYNRRMDGRTDEQPANIVPLPASLAWLRRKMMWLLVVGDKEERTWTWRGTQWTRSDWQPDVVATDAHTPTQCCTPG